MPTSTDTGTWKIGNIRSFTSDEVASERKERPCAPCRGSGRDNVNTGGNCSRCNGTGMRGYYNPANCSIYGPTSG